MYIVPLVRTCRAITACTFLPDNIGVAIASSEIFSYIIPFINNNPINAINNMTLFIFYFFAYNKSALDLIEQFQNKYSINYKIELASIFLYLIIYSNL
tara:strand:+ start:778 stop:1071 length:294 start_codon:yes stop_codon:yes gene_type:complete